MYDTEKMENRSLFLGVTDYRRCFILGITDTFTGNTGYFTRSYSRISCMVDVGILCRFYRFSDCSLHASREKQTRHLTNIVNIDIIETDL